MNALRRRQRDALEAIRLKLGEKYWAAKRAVDKFDAESKRLAKLPPPEVADPHAHVAISQKLDDVWEKVEKGPSIPPMTTPIILTDEQAAKLVEEEEG